jgi:hypothetical protein
MPMPPATSGLTDGFGSRVSHVHVPADVNDPADLAHALRQVVDCHSGM